MNPPEPKPALSKHPTKTPLRKLDASFKSNAARMMKSIGRSIRAARLNIYGLTQEQMADKLGLSHVTLRKIELGETVQAEYVMLVLAAMRRHDAVSMAANPMLSEHLVEADASALPVMLPIAAPAASPQAAPAKDSSPSGAAAGAPEPGLSPAEMLMRGVPLKRTR